MTLRILIADDHPPIRVGVRHALEEGGFEVCGEAATASAAVDLAVRLRPDVALLDVRMPGGGIQAAVQISELAPATTIVMLTVSRDEADLFDALRAGARGYLLKDIDPTRLPVALRAVLDGEAALPRELVTRLVDEFRGRERRTRGSRGSARPPALAKLTSREWQVLDLLREGLSTQEIAEKLFVAPVTVRTHVSGILRKLHVADRESAVRVADDDRP